MKLLLLMVFVVTLCWVDGKRGAPRVKRWIPQRPVPQGPPQGPSRGPPNRQVPLPCRVCQGGFVPYRTGKFEKKTFEKEDVVDTDKRTIVHEKPALKKTNAEINVKVDFYEQTNMNKHGKFWEHLLGK